jgi:hypothetical protein
MKWMLQAIVEQNLDGFMEAMKEDEDKVQGDFTLRSIRINMNLSIVGKFITYGDVDT